MIALLGLAASVGLIANSHPMEAGTIGVAVNAPAEVAADGNFKVDINVSDMTDFDAGQFDVCFDEAVFELDAVANGSIGTTPIPVDLWNRIGPGVYRILVNVPGIPGVDGRGSLVTLSFRAIGDAGVTGSIDLSNGFLCNNRAEEIPATWTGNSIALVTADGGASSSTDWTPILLAVPLGAMVALSAGWLVLARRKVRKTRG